MGSRSSYIHKSIKHENRVENTCALKLTCLWIILLSLSLFHLTRRFGVSCLTTSSYNIIFSIQFWLSRVCSVYGFLFSFSFFFWNLNSFSISLFPMPKIVHTFFFFISLSISDLKNSFFLCYCYWVSTLLEFWNVLQRFMAQQSMNYEILVCRLVLRKVLNDCRRNKQLINLSSCRINGYNWVLEAVMNLLMLINLS